MGAKERREREREEMRQAICRAAMKIFLAEGFEKTSVRRIAQEIEYTPGAIYSYFEDKDAILFALHSEGFARLRERLSTVPQAPTALLRLEEMGRVYLRFALENPEYYDLMFLMRATIEKAMHEEVWRAGMDTYDLLRRQVKACQDEGSLPPHPLEAATLSLWGIVHGLASLVVKDRLQAVPGCETLWPMVESAYEFSLKGLRAGAETQAPAARGRYKGGRKAIR